MVNEKEERFFSYNYAKYFLPFNVRVINSIKHTLPCGGVFLFLICSHKSSNKESNPTTKEKCKLMKEEYEKLVILINNTKTIFNCIC